MSGQRMFHSWSIFSLTIAGPILVVVSALGIVLLHILPVTELTIFDNGNAPESRLRIVGIGAVFLLTFLVSAPLVAALVDHRFRQRLVGCSSRYIQFVSFAALLSLGIAFSVFDMSFGAGDFDEVVLPH